MSASEELGLVRICGCTGTRVAAIPAPKPGPVYAHGVSIAIVDAIRSAHAHHAECFQRTLRVTLGLIPGWLLCKAPIGGFRKVRVRFSNARSENRRPSTVPAGGVRGAREHGHGLNPPVQQQRERPGGQNRHPRRQSMPEHVRSERSPSAHRHRRSAADTRNRRQGTAPGYGPSPTPRHQRPGQPLSATQNPALPRGNQPSHQPPDSRYAQNATAVTKSCDHHIVFSGSARRPPQKAARVTATSGEMSTEASFRAHNSPPSPVSRAVAPATAAARTASIEVRNRPPHPRKSPSGTAQTPAPTHSETAS